jgi:hypothetical protein
MRGWLRVIMGQLREEDDRGEVRLALGDGGR